MVGGNANGGLRLHTLPVIARESGQSSIPETVVIERDAAAYWMPRLRGGMTVVFVEPLSRPAAMMAPYS